MSQATAESRTVTIEREVPFPPERVWRALTQPHLIEAWLMKNDFAAEVGHAFTFWAEWGDVACRVTAMEPERSLTYTWSAQGLESVVTWTLAAQGGGTILRMEQTGFAADQGRAYHGARTGWPRFFDRLVETLGQP